MPAGYGKKIRKMYDESRAKASRKYKCPACSRTAIKRQSSGVWECQKCGKKYASGAYEFKVSA